MKLFKFTVEYRTLGGNSYSHSCYAADDSDAVGQAIDESHAGLCTDYWYHSTISVYADESDFIEKEGDS